MLSGERLSANVGRESGYSVDIAGVNRDGRSGNRHNPNNTVLIKSESWSMMQLELDRFAVSAKH